MSGRTLLSILLLILPALNLACNFTRIEPIMQVDKKLQLTIYTAGLVTKTFMDRPPNITKLPEKLVYKKEAKPGVVNSFNVLYPDGLNYTFNTYVGGPKNISFAYSFFEIFNGRVNKSNCVETKYQYKLGQPQDHIYYKMGTSHKKTSYTLKFTVEEMKQSSSYKMAAQSLIVLMVPSFFVILASNLY